MKQKYVWIGCIAVLVLGISTFIGCDDDSHDVVRFVGKAVYSGTSDPFVDIPVKVTDGQNTHCQTTTDAGGQFTLTVRISDIDGAYYLLAGDSTCVPKRVTLGGFGRMEVDLGSIEVEGPSLPIVETKPVSAIAASSATCGGNVTNDGRMQVTARGICWSTSEEPMIEDSYTTNGTGKGEFQTKITGLERNTTYYVRAYATNDKGTAYGNQVTFATTTGLPTVTTADISNITATTAKCGGEVLDNGGFTVTARGICWNTMGNPDINDSKTTNGSGNGTFTSNMTGLTPNTAYYVRAYAKNEKGTNYGEEKIFKTLDGVATITIAEATNITASSATCSANITDDGGATITERGFCYATSQYPTIDNSRKTVGGNGKGSINTSLTGLKPATTYYVRAYVINTQPSYSDQISFTTEDGLPIVQTTTTTATATTITSGGTITSDEGYSITARGVCYSTTNSTPTIADDHTTSGIGIGSFSSIITNVSTETTYYVRAYATNSIGRTGYGEVIIVTTGDGKPYVTTTKPTENGTTIVSGGNVTSEEGFPVTARGICYGTLPNPVIDNDSYKTTKDGEGPGWFTSTIDGSTIEGKIYIRAYATNVKGTTYGDEYEFMFNQEYYELPTFRFNGKTYKVAPDPHTSYTEYISWTAANVYCENLTYCGYDDWRLPTVTELETMYQNRNSIGGFINYSSWHRSYYHSSTFCDSYNKYAIDWQDGSRYCSASLNGGYELTYSYYYYAHVRPIRVHQ